MGFKGLLGLCAASVAIIAVEAHGGGGGHQKPIQVAPDADWATRHMAGTFPSVFKFAYRYTDAK